MRYLGREDKGESQKFLGKHFTMREFVQNVGKMKCRDEKTIFLQWHSAIM